MSLTAERLRERLHYDPETGEWSWRVLPRRRKPDGLPGTAHADGYWTITIDKKRYLSHRLAWLYITGGWPPADIDHIDGDRSNCRWANLRAVDRQQNLQNQRRASKNNKSGVLGAYWNGRRWISTICHNRKTYYVGQFLTAEEAHAAYLAKKREIHHGCTL